MIYFYRFWGDNRAGSAVALPLPKRKLFFIYASETLWKR